MCGICGQVSYKRPLGGSPDQILKMMGQLTHRGPDSQDYSISPNNHFGHTRLSIIDLEGGAQPIYNRDNSICTVFNGEIFNYLELKEEYLKGYPFKTASDTEVIIALYEKLGLDFINHLNGQFAIAIYDLRRKKSILIRDRVGICPLYTCEINDVIYFASEVKSFCALDSFQAKIDLGSYSEFIRLWTPLSPNTLFDGVEEVPPGCYVEIDDKGSVTKRYWDLYFEPDSCSLNIDQASEELDDLLEDAVRIRLRSDVPVGAYLSGGLDSTIILSYLQNQTSNLSSFSLTFTDEVLNEERFQQDVKNHFSTKHSSLKVNYNQVADNFVHCIRHTETPLFRTSPVPMMLLSKSVRDSGYKVVLTGEGSDEVFGGYDLFKEAKIREFWARFPDSEVRPELLRRLYPYLDLTRVKGTDYLKNAFGQGLENTTDLLYAFQTRIKTTSSVIDLLHDDYVHEMSLDTELAARDKFPITPGHFSVLNTAQYMESKTIMPGFILSAQGDRMLMANSVEGRYPFLDHRVIEFGQRLKNSYKLNGLNEKYILKYMTRNRIPKSVLKRPKQPYRSPDIDSLIRSRDNHLLDFLTEESVKKNGIFDSKKISFLVKKALSGRARSVKDNMLFTIALSTQIWYEEFLNQ